MATVGPGLMLAGLLVAVGCSQTTHQPTSAGPNGGDLVPIKGGATYAEVVANAETGEVLVNTWDKDLKTRRLIEKEPITVGSGNKSVELTPYPMDSDPSGTCSRCYGEANWVRGGGVHNGWMHGGGTGDHHVRVEPLLAGGPVARPHVEEMGRTGAWGQDMSGGRGHGPGKPEHGPRGEER